MDVPYFFRAARAKRGGTHDYLVEERVPDRGVGGLGESAEHVRVAAERVTAEGDPVRYVTSFLVDGDGTCLHLLEGCSAAAVVRVAQLAGLDAERVVKASAPRPDAVRGDR